MKGGKFIRCRDEGGLFFCLVTEERLQWTFLVARDKLRIAIINYRRRRLLVRLVCLPPIEYTTIMARDATLVV